MIVRVFLGVEHVRIEKSYMRVRGCFRVKHVIIKKKHVGLSLLIYIIVYICFIEKLRELAGDLHSRNRRMKSKKLANNFLSIHVIFELLLH